MTDRLPERARLDGVLDTVRGARSEALVLRGAPGVGKSALLDYLVDRAGGCLVLRCVGVESQMEVPFAGLQQLCAALAGLGDRADRLPPPQRSALLTVLGRAGGRPPDRFLVGLAVLTLLAEVATEQPLICVVDDEQWLDSASAQALGFVARRLGVDPVGLVFGARTPSAHLAGVPVLEVEGLQHEDARALLAAALPGPLDERVRDLVVAEARGNPLALLELPRILTPADVAGGFGLPAALPLARRIEAAFRRQLDDLPAPSRSLLQLAAADPTGDPALVRRAAARLGVPLHAAEPAVDAGLVEFGAQVRFRHPLVRSAAYWSASPAGRRQLHQALADATGALTDPDRRAWHRAHAAAGPDEDVAAELHSSAQRAQARGGLAAAAAFLQRAVDLTEDPGRKASRALAAAEATTAAGAFARALDVLEVARSGPLDELSTARAELLGARLAFVSGLGDDAPVLLLSAAARLQPLDPALAREAYLDAWMAASFAGRMRGPGSMEEVSRAARALAPAEHPRPVDQLLDALSALFTDGRTAAAPALRRVASRFAAGDVTPEQGLRFGWMAAALVWDDDAANAITSQDVELARAAGALDQLPIGLVALALSHAWRGDLATAAAQIAETEAVCEITGSHIAPYTAMFLAALRGDDEQVARLVARSRAEAARGGQGAATTYSSWVTAVLANGSGRYSDAFAAARAAVDDDHLYVSMWALPELVEAAIGVGRPDVARSALDLLTRSTTSGGTDFGLGIEARARALLADPATAEESSQEAIERLGRAGIRTELARAHLGYGESLRRQGATDRAREQLRTAHTLFDGMGMAAFAARARQELTAIGESVTERSVSMPGALTPQEALIARLAAEGLTNAEVGARLYLSPRTVEWHLRKVFAKLAVSSRRDLLQALAGQSPPTTADS